MVYTMIKIKDLLKHVSVVLDLLVTLSLQSSSLALAETHCASAQPSLIAVAGSTKSSSSSSSSSSSPSSAFNDENISLNFSKIFDVISARTIQPFKECYQ